MESKRDVKIEDNKSNLILENRKRLVLNGVIEVVSFNEEKITLNTTQGTLIIKGSNLKMNKLDVQNGEIIITGSIDSCVYSSAEIKVNKEGILAKLFK